MRDRAVFTDTYSSPAISRRRRRTRGTCWVNGPSHYSPVHGRALFGYPSFLGVFVGSGSSSSPQTQAQQQEQQQSGGSGSQGSNAGCYTSNANLTVPSAIAPVRSGTQIDGTICGSPAAAAGMTAGAVITAVNGQAVGLTRRLQQHPEPVPSGRHHLRVLGEPLRAAHHQQPAPDRRPAQ